ncbi:MAG: glutaminyl-tRNA synthetase [bacterium P3]|nr:MAG: glutaminyl-tRNA synthetase [bacterium P3]KWW41996.1 MAG: glutaminyl-tRNA synthetase [bacterium F083]
MEELSAEKSLNFLEEIIENDLREGRHKSILTRFPPEPNGYLHIGHAKSICINFGLAKKYGGKTNLRFDDTNPVKEDTEYVDSIQEDIHWLGFDWVEKRYASDYFDQLYEWAEVLIQKGLAYVDDQSLDEIREGRGTVTSPGKNSPCRDRSVEENLDLFRRMKAGEFPDGAKVLRAKIDMAHPNMMFRDPIMYRILHASHHRTGDKWCIYPMYDYAHGQSDSIENITHSICTLEFDIHRPLYDWFIQQLGIFPSHQYEFARLNINYMVMSKRKLLQLVKENYVSGWDDPRMPTICGFRRRGYTPESIKAFCDRIGVAKRDNIIDYSLLEFSLREHLNKAAQRRMAVLDPVRVVIDNYPDGQTEMLTAVNNPECEADGTREVPFSRELYIERDDFMEVAPKKYFRMAIGQEVRLRYAYFVTAQSVEKDADGRITCIHCTYDPATRGGDAPDGRKVKGTIHWVNAATAVDAEVRLFDRLFAVEAPDDCPEGKTFLDNLNPDSLHVVTAKCEPSLGEWKVESGKWKDGIVRYQFERMGYFCVDRDSTPGHPVFNRTCTLKDSWAKMK